VKTLSGKSLRLKIPPTTQNGQVFRLKGHGMPAVGKPNEPGDLYATVDVQLPRELTPEERAHYEALQKLEKTVTSHSAACELRAEIPSAYGGSEPGLSPRLSKVTTAAESDAAQMKDEYVSTEHLFLAIADEGGRSAAAQLLKQHNVTRSTILQALTGVRGSQ